VCGNKAELLKIKLILFLGLILTLGSVSPLLGGFQQKFWVQSPEIFAPQRASQNPTTPVLNLVSPNPAYSGSISLNWTVSSFTTFYYLFRDINPITDASIGHLSYLATTTVNNYTDVITDVGVYYYAVVATNIAHNSTASNCVNVTVVGNDWPMFRGDPTHRAVGVIGLGANYEQAWTYFMGGFPMEASPAVSNGCVYISSDGNSGNWYYKLFCVNAVTGAEIWNFTTGFEIHSSPAVANGCVYVGSWDGKLYCLDAVSGAEIWNYTSGGPIGSSPVVDNGSVYVGSNSEKLSCVNAITGVSEWNYTTGSAIESSPAVDNGYVYVGSDDHNLSCVNAITGASKWNYTMGNEIKSSPTVVNGCVYVGSDDGRLYCLDAVSGAEIWNYSTEGIIGKSSPAVIGERVYIGSTDGNLTCVNASTGEWIWNYTTGSAIESSPAVAGGFVYVGSDDYHFYCLNAATGALVWNSYTSSQQYSSPAMAGGCVYVGGNGGLLCYKPTSVPFAPVVQPITPNSNFTGSISLYWGPVSGAMFYNVYRSTSVITAVNGLLTRFSTVNATTWQDNLSSCVTYYYVVTAVNINGESAISNCVQVGNGITGTGLTPWQLCNATPPAYSLNFGSPSSANATWYSLDGGLTNTTCGLAGTLSTQWGKQPNGTVMVTFWANDSANYVVATSLVIQRDIIAPIITITSPQNQQTSSDPPQLTFTVVDANLNKVWYTIGANPTKFFLTNESAEIDAAAWAALPAGNVNITLYANDTVGNEAYSPLVVIKQAPSLDWTWIILGVLVAVTVAFIAIPSLRKKKKTTARRFASTTVLTPAATISAEQANNIAITNEKQGLQTPVEETSAPLVASIPLSDMSEDESEKAAVGESGVYAFRGGRIVGPRFIYKVKVKNATKMTITDIGIQLVSYPRDCMRLVTEEIRHVSKIEPGGFRSLEFELQPQKDCVEGALISSVNYLDSLNELFTIHVKPFVLKSVCDLMEPLVIPEAAFDEIVSHWGSTQELVTFKGEDSLVLAEDVPVILENKNFHPVSHQVQEEGGILNSITKGIATGKYTKRRLAVTVSITADVKSGDGSITCKGHAEDASMLVACLSELLAEFRKPLVRQVRKMLKDRKGVANLEDLRAELQVELPTLADAVRQEPDFVFLHSGEQVATYTYLVDFLNALRPNYDTVPVADLEAELRPAGKTMQGILQELIGSGKLRASWIGASEIRFKAELHKVAIKSVYYVVGFISGLVSIIIFLLSYLK